MTLFQATRNFYHDAVGTRAHNEVFEIKDQKVSSDLEKSGYVKKAEGEHVQAHEEQQAKQQQTGQTNAQANERVSIANHEHNMNANKHHEQLRNAKVQAVPTQAEQQGTETTQAISSQHQAQKTAKQQNKKADNQ
jgi:hypothetical protein